MLKIGWQAWRQKPISFDKWAAVAVNQCKEVAATAMSRDVTGRHPTPTLEEGVSIMKMRGIANVPIIDDEACPVDVLNTRDALEVL